MFLDQIKENSIRHADYVIYSDEIHQNGLTNATLYEQSGRIYSYLKDKGIGKEDFVMIRLPRGYDFCTAMLGVWKAGAGVVILEDTYVQERVSFIYRDCGCVFEINKDNWNEILLSPFLDDHEPIQEHDAAFAVYTSGSTGNPKGVLHEFGNIERIIQSMYLADGSFIIEKNDQFSLLIPLNFVAFLLFVCGSLYFGQAHSWIVSYDTVKNKKSLASFFLKKKINFTFLTPSYVRQLGTSGPYLKKLLVGSEPANDIYKNNIKIYNVYAMTESGFPVSIFLINKKYKICPIGEKNELNKIILLDEFGKEVSQGEIGEICFENPFVRGYINLPELTKKVFRDGVYYTGDLGKVCFDGHILYIGRKDDMVKIDGNRVEPGEVEAVCKDVLKLNDCVAKGFEKEGVIALYYTGNYEINAIDAKNKLSTYLPYYMIPTYYFNIKELPKNSFGKVMRKDLKIEIQRNEKYVAPRNDFERKLVDAFSSVLGIEQIGIKDDFFQLGGNSLKTIELLSILEEENISAQLLFEMRTIENVSDFFQQNKNSKTTNRLNPNSIVYGIMRLLSFFISHFIFKREILRNEIKDVDGPYVVLANHEAALDFCNLIGMTKRRMIAVMSYSYYQTIPFQKIFNKLNFIPKQQFQTDFQDIMRMKDVIEQGYPLVIYPAGIQPTDGISTSISSKTWNLLKFLNVDVYIARCEGTYFVKPKWSSSYHPGKTTMDVYRLFSKEELEKLSFEQIEKKALEALEFDAYKEQKKNKWTYKNSTVDGLQNVLYMCPKCKNEYTIHVENSNTLTCSCCGFTQVMDSYGMMHNEKEPKDEIQLVSDWSRCIKEELKKKIKDGFSIKEEVEIHTIDKERNRFVKNGKGILRLDNCSLVLEGELFSQPFSLNLPSNSLAGLPVQPGKYFEIQVKQEIYRCYLKRREMTVQIVDLLTLLYTQIEDTNRSCINLERLK